MRVIRLSNFVLYGIGLLLLVATSAGPSHGSTATGGQFNTPYLVFGTQPVGQSGLTQTGILTFGTGTGAVVVTITGITISGPNAGDFSAAGNGATPCNVGTTINVNVDAPASCTLGGTFTPSATGTRTATITVTWSVSAGLNDGPVTLNVVGGDEVAYVSTGVGGQILTVDGTSGAFEILSNGPVCTGTGPCFNPTGAVVGPDAKIYITDEVFSNVWRMNQDGTGLQQIYSGSSCPDSSPCNVEGPSFDSAGNLYFNTFGTGQGLFVMNASAGDAFGSPVSVEPCTDGGGGCPNGGTGTAFDGSGNLLAADELNSEIWSLAPPYNTTPTAILNNSSNQVQIGQPIGIALNKGNDQVYVAQYNGGPEANANQIVSIVPPLSSSTTYTTIAYYTFGINSACDSPDDPEYIQSDMSGTLFGTTSTDPINTYSGAGSSGCGKVWRIDPPESSPNCIGNSNPCATLLVDLNAAYTGGIAGVCFAPCGLNAAQAIGVAMPPTTGPTQTVPLSSSGGTYAAGIPSGCAVTEVPPNPCISTITGVYPAGIYSTGDTMNITFNEVSQAQYAARVLSTPYSMTTLAAIPGWNGNGIVPSLVCLSSSGTPCDDSVTPGTSYEIFTTWQTNQTNYCGMTPHLLRGDPLGGPYTFLVDTLVPASCQVEGEPSAGTKGKSSCTSSSSSSCASDWLNSTGPVTGPTATATITSPANGATFLLNQPETAAFSCSPTPPVMLCPGIVTEPNGTIASATNGGPVPTSQSGTYTLSVNPNVDGGSPGTGASSTYTVLACQDVALAFNPSTVPAGTSTSVTATLQSCNSKIEVATVAISMSGPFGRSCGSKPLPTFSFPLLLGPKPDQFNFNLPIPSGSCDGTYTVTAQTSVNKTLVDTTTATLTVTAP